MQINSWHPLQDMDELFNRYNRRVSHRFPLLNDDKAIQWTPSADISETKKEFLIKAELPDVEKSDIHVSVREGTLTIEGERSRANEEKGETLHRVESFYGKFMRSFLLPANADTTNIKADCKKGVLRVHVPKNKDAKVEAETEIQIS